MALAAKKPAILSKSTAVAPRKSSAGAVVPWKERLAADVKKHVDQEASTATGSFITLPSGILTYQGNSMPNNEMTAIILDSIIEHNLYEGSFNPNSPANPICFSFGTDEDDMVAHEKSEQPQGGKDGHCADCEHFQWGTGTDNQGQPTKGKACQSRRRLMLLPDSVLKGGVDAIRRSEVAYLKIPVTSVKGWSSFVKLLAAQYELPPLAFITQIKVVRDVKTQFRVEFHPQGQIEDDETLEALVEKRDAHQDEFTRPYEKRIEAPKPAAKSAGKPKYR